jgi:AraC-like DNA-binding protein
MRYLATHPKGRAAVEAGQAAASLADPELRIPLAEAGRLLDGAIELTGDSAIGLHAAPFFEPGDRDLLEAAARNCSTLRAALECTIRYIRLISDEATYSLDMAGDRAIFSRHSAAQGTALRVASDFAMLDMVQFLRRHATVDEAQYAVEFEHAEPDYVGEYHRLFRCQVRFGAGRNALVFHRTHLDLPMKAHCPALADAVTLRAEGQLSRLAEEATIAFRVQELVRAHLSSGEASMGWVARQLGFSAPTLRRRLDEEDTTFSSIMDEVRREVAERELQGKRSVSEIAFRLGFSSTSAFDRAFKRWHAMLPSAYRERLVNGESR